MLHNHYPSFELNFEEGMEGGGEIGEEASGSDAITHPNSVCGGTNVALSCFLKPPLDACLSGSAKYIFQGLFSHKGFQSGSRSFLFFPPSLC